MRSHATITPGSGDEYIVTAPEKLVVDGRPHYVELPWLFDTIEGARDFCWACNWSWSIVVPLPPERS